MIFHFSNFWDDSTQRCIQDFVIDFIKQYRWQEMFPISFVDNLDFRLENGTRLLSSVRIRNRRSSRDDIFSWAYRRSSTKNMIHKDTTQITKINTNWSQMMQTLTSNKSNSIKWKDDQQDLLPHFPSVWLKIQSVLFSVFFFVVCLVLLVVRQTNIVHSFRISSSFHVQFPLDITKLICPQNVDLSAQWILNWFHDVPFSENEIKYPIHEELYQHTVSSILACSIQIVDQIKLFESYFLLERLDQLFFLRNYVNLYFQRESFSNSEFWMRLRHNIWVSTWFSVILTSRYRFP